MQSRVLTWVYRPDSKRVSKLSTKRSLWNNGISVSGKLFYIIIIGVGTMQGRGYLSVFPLSKTALDILYYVVLGRLAQS